MYGGGLALLAHSLLVVCISAAICNALNLSFVLSFGVLFPKLLDYFKETRERTDE